MSYIFAAERTRDCDGSGWAFWRFNVDPAIVDAYGEALRNWEIERAIAFDRFMDAFNLRNDLRGGIVNDGAYDLSIDNVMTVNVAYNVMNRRLDYLIDAIRASDDAHSTGCPFRECDFTTDDDFRSRYMPLVKAADEANGRAFNDTFSHWNYLTDNGYTSIFNGR